MPQRRIFAGLTVNLSSERYIVGIANFITEFLMPTFWTGTQWKVTNEGVDTVDNKYFIAKNRVHDDEGGAWTWENQMEEKGWVHMGDFREAMAFARKKWPKK